jgi:cyclophilin family peptidyl-prolyl cis-trans isomerase
VALGRRLSIALVVLALAGCGGGSKKSSLDCQTVSGTPTGGKTQKPPTTALDPSKTYTVVLKTNFGSFSIKLDQKTSPSTAASFVSLTDNKFFDGTIFHRIVPGFVIQGGDPTGTGEGGPGYSCVDTPPSSTKYVHGVVAMAKTGSEPPGTSGSQFFVMTADAPTLPPDYAVLGTVSRGLAVVDKIGTFGNASEQPTKRVVIQKAIVHVG